MDYRLRHASMLSDAGLFVNRLPLWRLDLKSTFLRTGPASSPPRAWLFQGMTSRHFRKKWQPDELFSNIPDTMKW